MERPKGLFDPTYHFWKPRLKLPKKELKLRQSEKNYEWVRVCAFKCVCTCHLELRIVCARVDMQKIKCNILSRWNKHSTYATNSKKVWKDWHAYFAETNEKKATDIKFNCKKPHRKYCLFLSWMDRKFVWKNICFIFCLFQLLSWGTLNAAMIEEQLKGRTIWTMLCDLIIYVEVFKSKWWKTV